MHSPCVLAGSLQPSSPEDSLYRTQQMVLQVHSPFSAGEYRVKQGLSAGCCMNGKGFFYTG